MLLYWSDNYWRHKFWLFGYIRKGYWTKDIVVWHIKILWILFAKPVYLRSVFYRKCPKPLKPKVTVQIASDTGQSQSKDAVQPIPIFGAKKRGSSILIAYGSPVFLSFETIVSVIVTLLYIAILIYITVTFFTLNVDGINFWAYSCSILLADVGFF